MEIKTALLRVIGPSTLVLAQYLEANHAWVIDRIEQTSSMRGSIVGRHEDPEDFVGFGISDGTRISSVEVAADETENTE